MPSLAERADAEALAQRDIAALEEMLQLVDIDIDALENLTKRAAASTTKFIT